MPFQKCSMMLLGLSLLSAPVAAQSRQTVTLTADAPVFVTARESQTPLRVGKAGSVMRLLDMTPEWVHVEFEDPRFGRRVGYVQMRYVNVSRSEEPVDLSIRDTERPNRQQAQQPVRTPPRAPLPTQRTVDGPARSTSSGFFVGVGIEGNAIVPINNGISSATESGRGGGLVLGYGFNPRWSLYGTLSAASVDAVDFPGTYGLGHFDLGTRIHFLAGEHRVVPFLQAGLAGRAVSQDFTIGTRNYTVTARGAGAEFGGGLNAHFTPGFAFSGGVTWMVGNFSTYEVNGQNVGGDPIGAASARVHLGIIWFPTRARVARVQPDRTPRF